MQQSLSDTSLEKRVFLFQAQLKRLMEETHGLFGHALKL